MVIVDPDIFVSEWQYVSTETNQLRWTQEFQKIHHIQSIDYLWNLNMKMHFESLEYETLFRLQYYEFIIT